MREDIKARIESARRGEVPDGYSDSIAGVLPNDWTSKPLSEISEVLSEQAGDGNYETLSISAGIGFVNQAEKFGKELSGKQYAKYTVLRRGDFAYNKGNSKRYPQGCTYMLKEREEAAVPNVFECFRITEGHPEYYEQLFINGFMNRQLTRKINHGVRDDGLLNLTDDDFYSTILPIPPLAEQQKIAEILSTCDRVIELKQQLLDEKRKQKQWLMQMLLDPDSGVRLPGFEGSKWMETTLGKIGEFYQPQTIAQNQLTNTGYPVFGANGQIGYYSEYNHERPQILITCRGATCGQVNMSLPYSWINGNAMVFNVDNNALFSKEFLYYLCDHLDFTSIISGSGQPQITALPLEKYKASVPSIKEQESLAQLFKTMDEGINFIAEELEAWQKKKKALMQLLLTGLVRVNA